MYFVILLLGQLSEFLNGLISSKLLFEFKIKLKNDQWLDGFSNLDIVVI